MAGVDSRDFWYDDGPWDNFVLHRRKRNRIKSRGVKFPWGGHSRCYWTFVWHTTRIAQGDCLQSNGCPCLSKMGVSLDLKAEQTVYRFQNLLFVFVLSVQLKNRLKCWLILRLSSCQKVEFWEWVHVFSINECMWHLLGIFTNSKAHDWLDYKDSKNVLHTFGFV